MKVKIKRVRGGSMGDQRDYGLVTGSVWNRESAPSMKSVSSTMGPTDREDATIEAERGETIVGDLNNDGQLEHVIVGGKRHFQGGTPLNVPDGSFVFSDYRGLLIKNKDLLSGVFNYKGGKSATPAKIARRYELNRYNDILNDPNADWIDQKTAQLMIDNNLKKLGQLALVQEDLKGFPDGIPDIALPLFANEMSAGGPPKMKKGGLVKAQVGLNKRPFDYHPAANFPLNHAEDILYQQDQPMRGFETALNVMSHPISALTYAVDPRAQNQSFLSYVKNSPHALDVPLTWNRKLPFMEPAAVGDLTDLYTQVVQYLPPFQSGAQVPKKPSFFDFGWNDIPAAILGAASIPLGGAGLQYLANAVPQLWREGSSFVVPVGSNRDLAKWKNRKSEYMNVKTGKPYPKGHPKYGRAVELVQKPGLLRPAVDVIKKIKLPGNKWGWIISGVGAVAGLAGKKFYDYQSALDAYNAIPTKQEQQPQQPTAPANRDYRSVINARSYPTTAPRSAPAPTTTLSQTSANQQTAPAPTPSKTGNKVVIKKSPVDPNAPILDTASFLKNAGIEMKKGGPALPKAQTGYYKIQDPNWASLQEDFEEIRPGYYPGWKSVGYQRPSADPGSYVRGSSMEILPRVGFKNPNTGVTYSGLDDFVNYANPFVNFEDYGSDDPNHDVGKGMQNWRADMSSSDAAKRQKAGDWLARRANEYNQGVSGNSNLLTIDPGQKGYWELGSKNLNIPFLRRKAKKPDAPAKQEETYASTDAIPPDLQFEGAQRPRSVGYFPGDIAALAAAYTQELPEYLLTKSRLDPSLIQPAYTEFDPSAIMGAYNAYLQNVGTGAEGRGAALSATGATGKSLEALNRERQANRASNIDVFLRTQAANQQAINQANVYNAEEDKAYIDRLNTLENAGVLDRNQKAALIAEKFGRAESNLLKLNNINAMLPYQYSDWEGTTVNPTLRSIYDNPITGSGSGSSGYSEIFDSIYQKLIADGASPGEASRAAAQYATGMTRSRGGYGTSGSATSIYDFLT